MRGSRAIFSSVSHFAFRILHLPAPFAIILLSLFGGPAIAGRSAGSSALIIGRLPVGVRPIALSGAYAAVAGEPSAIYWNPAGLAKIDRARVAVQHTEQGERVKMENILYAQPVPGGGTVAGAASYLNMPPIRETREDEAGNYAGEGPELFSYEFKAAGGFGQDLKRLGTIPWLGPLWNRGLAGASVNVLGESVAGERSYSISADVGYIFEAPVEGLSMGLVARQLGVPVDNRLLPMTGQAGFAQELGQWLVTADFLTASDDALRGRAGLEWSYGGPGYRFIMRGGLQHSFSSELLAPYSGGLSVEFNPVGAVQVLVEYAFVPVSGFQAMHAASVEMGL
jgi:hypothetical protein